MALHLDLVLSGLFPVVHLGLLLLEEGPSLRFRHVLQQLVLVLPTETERRERGRERVCVFSGSKNLM